MTSIPLHIHACGEQLSYSPQYQLEVSLTDIFFTPSAPECGSGAGALVHLGDYEGLASLLQRLRGASLLKVPDRDGQLAQFFAQPRACSGGSLLGVPHTAADTRDHCELVRVLLIRRDLADGKERLENALQADALLAQLSTAVQAQVVHAADMLVGRELVAQLPLLMILLQAYDLAEQVCTWNPLLFSRPSRWGEQVIPSLCSLVGFGLLLKLRDAAELMAHRLSVLGRLAHLTWGEAQAVPEHMLARGAGITAGCMPAFQAAMPLAYGEGLNKVLKNAAPYVAAQVLTPPEMRLLEMGVLQLAFGDADGTFGHVLARAMVRVMGVWQGACEQLGQEHVAVSAAVSQHGCVTLARALVGSSWDTLGELKGEVAAEMVALASGLLMRTKDPAAYLSEGYKDMCAAAAYSPQGLRLDAVTQAQRVRRDSNPKEVTPQRISRWLDPGVIGEGERLRLLYKVKPLFDQHAHLASCVASVSRDKAAAATAAAAEEVPELSPFVLALAAGLHACEVGGRARELVGSKQRACASLRRLVEYARRWPQLWEPGWAGFCSAMAMRSHPERMDWMAHQVGPGPSLQDSWQWLTSPAAAVFAPWVPGRVQRPEHPQFSTDPSSLFEQPRAPAEGVGGQSGQSVAVARAEAGAQPLLFDMVLPTLVRMTEFFAPSRRGLPLFLSGRPRGAERWDGWRVAPAQFPHMLSERAQILREWVQWREYELRAADHGIAPDALPLAAAGWPSVHHGGAGQSMVATPPLNPHHAVWQRLEPAARPAQVVVEPAAEPVVVAAAQAVEPAMPPASPAAEAAEGSPMAGSPEVTFPPASEPDELMPPAEEGRDECAFSPDYEGYPNEEEHARMAEMCARWRSCRG